MRYWLEGADTFAGAASFPVPGSQPVRFYLSAGGEDSQTHRLSPGGAPVGGSNSWVAVPLGAPPLGGLDEVANQILIYQAVMSQDTELAGPVSARLQFSCNEIDSHVVARLGRVDAAGEYHLLSMGTISPARRKPDPARSTSCEIALDTGTPQPLIPGEPVTLCFSLTPQPTQLSAGDRLQFDVASRTDLLRSDVSHGHAQFDLHVPPYFSRNTLHYGPDTYLEVYRTAKRAGSITISG